LNGLLERIRSLVSGGEVRISEHGYDELAEDGLTAREVLAGVQSAVLVEQYPDYPKGPCVLLLQKDHIGQPVHVVWGIPKGHDKPAVLVTAYRPDSDRWDERFLVRR
jgi:hypothetical protein